MKNTFKQDWFRIITDLTRKGMTEREIEERIGAGKSSVNHYKSQGREPLYSTGAALVALHAEVCHPAGTSQQDRLVPAGVGQ